ncbi:uncharacterized protein MKK02DRAFT_44229 [Dioszegia hungarica]|uniref:NAD(P)-binding protein n=1 Tax=Dioszegia hungarica TaxID=4972 RepID=A0AA38H9W4_9TREE|nr:uncharacterized protein MKK02DRAFT_44229 [Dioszegia hungarica]KAI9635539.1 hypothetical protein MKK02DRAFT_44229 [Dioszegia hungarica]
MSSSRSLTILTAADVDRVLASLDLDKAIASQAAVFDAFSAVPSSASTPENGVPPIQNPHRTTIETEQSTSLFMPARVTELGGATCKIVSVPKASAGPNEGGLPAATVVLDDKGVVRGLVNARKLTAMRNACGSALFLRRCPPAGPITQCVFFGSGEQIYAHASVFLRLYGSIVRCTFVVRSKNERAVGLVRRLEAEHPAITLYLRSADSADTSPSSALSDLLFTAQVIVAATSSQKALFPTSSVRPGTRVILIGSYKPHMREVEDSLLRRASRVVVDSKKACLQEAGELISAGITEEDLEELGSMREGGKPVRSREDIVLFKSVGLGVQDVAITKLILDEAINLGIGTQIAAFD